ncbi:hypothetical protein MAR_018207 [Mya arenaria]|uniref:Uncharacterized protein n=1 Tax=Mya arenaria TaxID=6604 RepID=A0ABY7EGG6_MYAAR|nr:hypothetical protein MAR_018207 [Mya arenaria]
MDIIVQRTKVIVEHISAQQPMQRFFDARRADLNRTFMSLDSEVYATTWGERQNNSIENDLTIGRYNQRGDPMRDRVKSIVITDRLMPGRMSTHGYWSKKPYKKSIVKESYAVLKHYRTCRKEWMKNNGAMCYKLIKRHEDNTLVQVADLIRENVINVMERIKEEMSLVAMDIIVQRTKVIVDHISAQQPMQRFFDARRADLNRTSIVNESYAVLKHYRTCRMEWMNNNGTLCYKLIERHEDNTLVQVADLIRVNVMNVMDVIKATMNYSSC